MKPKLIVGILLVLLGAGVFVYNESFLRPEREAREMMVEATMIYERGDKESINQAINIFTKVIAKYPSSRLIPEAYYLIGQCYERIGLNRLAFLKYSYLIKNNHPHLSADLRKEVMIRLARLNVIRQYNEEGINQLYALLNANYNRDLRSRIYSELGHTYLRLGEYQRSRRMFDIALAENGTNEEALVGKARAFKHLGMDDDAYDTYEYFLRYYGAVSQYASDVRSAYRDQAYRSGLAAFRKGSYEGAISYFNRVLKNFPDDRLAENAMYWIGESNFAQRRFDTAISWFNRALSNSQYHKDEDAQIKKGYAYFLSKRFDLAAREFQTYLRNYPAGRHAATAREWKSMSTKELLYRIEGRKTPDEADEEESPTPDDSTGRKITPRGGSDEEVAGEYGGEDSADDGKIELENVAEL